MIAPLHPQEPDRLDALRSYRVLDTGAEPAFDEITQLAAEICATPISLVSLVDERRQWFKSRVGLAVSEAPRDVAFCAHAILQDDLMVVPDALADHRFRENPFVLSEPKVRFYAGSPLVNPQGFPLGTLCVIDTRPRELTASQGEALGTLGRAVVALLEARRLAARLAEMAEERTEIEDHLERFFSLSVDMLCIAGFDGYFKALNGAWTRTLGYSLEELKAKPFVEFVHPDDRGSTLAEAARLREGAESVSFENRYLCPDGSYRWLLWSAGVSLDSELYYAVARDNTTRKQREQQLTRDAFHDPMTGLANRIQILDRLDRLVGRARQSGHRVAALYVDLDCFKAVNDTHGHEVGDEFLIAVARRLDGSIRPGDIVGRLGGDEFLILLDGVQDGADALRVAARIQQALAAPVVVAGRALAAGVSIGAAVSGPHHERAKDLLRDADAAMYQAKAKGKGRSVLWEG